MCIQITYVYRHTTACFYVKSRRNFDFVFYIYIYLYLFLFFYIQDPCAAVQWSTNTKIATSVSAMSSTPSPRPTAETRPNQSKKTQHGGQTLDLSPHDLKKYLSQPVRSIFHEQAKSIVAIQVRKSCLKKIILGIFSWNNKTHY